MSHVMTFVLSATVAIHSKYEALDSSTLLCGINCCYTD